MEPVKGFNGHSSSWTEQDVEILTREWTEGNSTREIIDALGGKFGKNAVIGKARRLGLPSHPNRPRAAGKRSENGKAGALLQKLRRQQQLRPPQQFAIEQIETGELRSVECGPGIPFIELSSKNCHWPLGALRDPPTKFCGQEAFPGQSYCAAHYCLSLR